jgi:hypothetical protein
MQEVWLTGNYANNVHWCYRFGTHSSWFCGGPCRRAYLGLTMDSIFCRQIVLTRRDAVL